jgi:hypothetical protein
LERHKLTLPLQPAMPDLVLVAIGSACGVHGSRRHRCGQGRWWFSADPPLGEMGSAPRRRADIETRRARPARVQARPLVGLLRPSSGSLLAAAVGTEVVQPASVSANDRHASASAKDLPLHGGERAGSWRRCMAAGTGHTTIEHGS